MPNREYEQGRDRFDREDRWGRDEQQFQRYQQHPHQQHLVRDNEYGLQDARWRNEMMYQQWLDQQQQQLQHQQQQRFQQQYQEQRPMGRAPKGYQRSDERIKEDLCDRLMGSWINAEEVEIQVRAGEIVLAGTVEDRQSKRAIEDIAERVLGVKDVQNNIRVQRREDEQDERAQISGRSRKPTA